MSFEVIDSSRPTIIVKSERHGDSIRVSPNYDLGSVAAESDNLVFVNTLAPDNDYEPRRTRRSFTISRDEAAALRDHLDLIVTAHDNRNGGESAPKAETNPLTAALIKAVGELTDEIRMLDFADLREHTDALDNHANALKSFNN